VLLGIAFLDTAHPPTKTKRGLFQFLALVLPMDSFHLSLRKAEMRSYLAGIWGQHTSTMKKVGTDLFLFFLSFSILPVFIFFGFS
jgi:hypothetical protein